MSRRRNERRGRCQPRMVPWVQTRPCLVGGGCGRGPHGTAQRTGCRGSKAHSFSHTQETSDGGGGAQGTGAGEGGAILCRGCPSQGDPGAVAEEQRHQDSWAGRGGVGRGQSKARMEGVGSGSALRRLASQKPVDRPVS